MKNSDSDYKAEDEGSANEASKRKPSKKNQPIRLNKKEMIETSNKHDQTTISNNKMEILTQVQYQHLQTIQDALEFSLNNKCFLAKVTKVVDGDTIKAVLYLNDHYTKFTFRFNGLDTPETRKGDVKDFGKKVKEIILSMLDQKIVKIQSGDFDKYGRILAKIYTFSDGKQLCVNDFLIENKLAKEYFGKTKNEFTSQDEDEFMQRSKNKIWPKTQNYPLSE